MRADVIDSCARVTREYLFFVHPKNMLKLAAHLGAGVVLYIEKNISGLHRSLSLCNICSSSGGAGVSQVVKIVDLQVSHIDPNVIHQPNISPDKLSKMWSAVKAKWNAPHANYKKSESGNNQEWVSFCGGREGMRYGCGRGIWLLQMPVIW